MAETAIQITSEITETVLVISEKADAVIIRSSQQGIQGPPGLDGTTVVQADTVDISAGLPEVIDSLLVSDTRSIKWFLTINDPLTDRHRSLEVLAVRDSSGMTHQSYGMIGDPLDYIINVVISGPNILLTFVNNELNDLDVQILRLPTLV